MLFPRAYVQSGVCGPSRMSYYTGRYMFSHGATWNRVPLSLREKTIGDYLRPAGIRVALAGKTHVLPDLDGLERYGIEGGSAHRGAHARRPLRGARPLRRPFAAGRGERLCRLPARSRATIPTIRGATT